ncbi:hypothetical protein AcW1_000766 [Taiwanofungus camphoratus]|nr:hypothetical protein AcW1_000766 [Antrodia cinnamomea]
MSLSELTRNSFQSGIPAKKWVNLSKLFLSSNHIHVGIEDIQSDISNSVLVVFRDYPGDPALQGYLTSAIQDGLLPLATYVATFLSAARSPDLHDPTTLDMLCRVALDSHYASGMPALGSIVPYSESTIELLGTVQNAMALLRTAHSLPLTHYHQLILSASELLVLLLSCVTDVSQISTAQAMVHFADASDMLQVLRLTPNVRGGLETFALSLSLLLGDDAKAAREAQMMHTLQLALGKGDVLGSSSDTDIVTCSLLLHNLVLGRAKDFGSGDGHRVIAMFIGLFRWSSWTPIVFYTQLLLSAFTCVTQSASFSASSRSVLIWRAFVIGRLPHLLAMFQKAAESEGIADADWNTTLQIALSSVLHRTDLVEKCNNDIRAGTEAGGGPVIHRVFTLELLHSFISVGLIDPAFAATIDPTVFNDYHPRLLSEAQEIGMDLTSYLESRISTEASADDTAAFLEKICRDPCSHSAFAEIVQKRFTSLAHSLDVEPLSHLCKILCKCDPALDIVSLHIRLTELVAHALAFVEDYDCETVGDPQTAVIHLGDIVLFLQSTVARFNLSLPVFVVGNRILNADLLRLAATIHNVSDLKGEDASAFNAWFKALFDSSCEGIEDTIFRTTRPKTLLRIAPTLFSHAITMCLDRKLEEGVLHNGLSFFSKPLLNWTLAGVVKSLLLEIQHRGFNAPAHLEVLQTLLRPCPQPILSLSAPAILRLFSDAKKYEHKRTGSFDPTFLRRIALEALGLPHETGARAPLSLHSQGTSWTEQLRQDIRDVLSAARAGKAPVFDVDRCLLRVAPGPFLYTLWNELVAAATMGDMDLSRRIASFVLATPRCSRSPPLLPMFLHIILPALVEAADHLTPSDQAVTVELLVAVISSALTGALHLEWALLTVCQDQSIVLGESVAAMARRLSNDLRRKGHGPTSGVITQRLASSPPFVANFPTFIADL